VNNGIKEGNILLREGILLPEALQIRSEPYVPGWRLATDLDAYNGERDLQRAGWMFFSLAGEIKSIVFGTSERSMLLKAIKRILADPKSKNFNCLEITRIRSKWILGIGFVSVGAQSRQIQKSLFLLSGKEERSGRTRIASLRTMGWGATSAPEPTQERTNGQPTAATAARS